MIWILAILAVPLAYVLFVTWAMRQPVEVFYHTFWSAVFRRLLPNMRAISLWRWVILFYPPGDPRGRLGVIGRIHELSGHILNPDQWAGRPLSFPFLYVAEMIRCAVCYGPALAYDKNRFEQEARRIAGEPAR